MPIQQELQFVFAVVPAVLDQMRRVQAEGDRRIAHTEQVIAELSAVHTEGVHLELAARGYVMDGNQSRASAYRSSATASEDHIRKVASLTADNRNQVQRILDLQHHPRLFCAFEQVGAAKTREGTGWDCISAEGWQPRSARALSLQASLEGAAGSLR